MNSSYKFLYLNVLFDKVKSKIIICNFIATEISKEGLYENDNLSLLEGQYSFGLLCLDILFHGVFLIDKDFEKGNVPKPTGRHDYLSALKRLDEKNKETIQNHFKDNITLKKVLTKFHADFNRIRYPHQYLEDIEDLKGYETEDGNGFVYELNYYNSELCWLINYLGEEIGKWIENESEVD
jgi:hypothetical protein